MASHSSTTSLMIFSACLSKWGNRACASTPGHRVLDTSRIVAFPYDFATIKVFSWWGIIDLALWVLTTIDDDAYLVAHLPFMDNLILTSGCSKRVWLEFALSCCSLLALKSTHSSGINFAHGLLLAFLESCELLCYLYAHGRCRFT